MFARVLLFATVLFGIVNGNGEELVEGVIDLLRGQVAPSATVDGCRIALDIGEAVRNANIQVVAENRDVMVSVSWEKKITGFLAAEGVVEMSKTVGVQVGEDCDTAVEPTVSSEGDLLAVEFPKRGVEAVPVDAPIEDVAPADVDVQAGPVEEVAAQVDEMGIIE